MRHVRQECAQSNDQVDSALPGQIKQGRGIRFPAQVRLDAYAEHQVLLGGCRAAIKKVISRPADLAVQAVAQLHLRPQLAEVVKLFRLETGEPACLQLLDEKLRGVGGCTAGIVPTSKCDDEHRVCQSREFFND